LVSRGCGTGVLVLVGGGTAVSVLVGGGTAVLVLVAGGSAVADGTALVGVRATFVGVDVSAGRGELVGVGGGTGVLVRVGGAPPTGVAVGVGKLGVSVGTIATSVATGVSAGGTVPITGVLVGPNTAERGVTVGWGVIKALPGVVVGAFCGAAITITSLVETMAATSGVGLSNACAASVARSAAWAAAAPGAIGGNFSRIFQGL
jgi:hypothetical protein